MKSLLVDALRQAKSNEKSLTDSGSFDVQKESFAETANDANVDDRETPAANSDETAADNAYGSREAGDNSIDLALMDTMNGTLPVQEPLASRSMVDTQSLVTANEKSKYDGTFRSQDHHPMSALSTARMAPLWAQLAPLLCVVTAILSGAGWVLYQESIVGDAAALSSSTELSGSVGSSAEGAAKNQRFPYLSYAAETIDEAAQ